MPRYFGSSEVGGLSPGAFRSRRSRTQYRRPSAPLASPGPKALVGLSPETQPLSRAFLPSSSSRTGGGSGRPFEVPGAACWRPLMLYLRCSFPMAPELLLLQVGYQDPRTSKPNPRGSPPRLRTENFRATLSREPVLTDLLGAGLEAGSP